MSQEYQQPYVEPFPQLPGQLGINPRYIAPKPEILTLSEEWCWSGGDFSVTTAEGYDVVRCEGQTMSMSGRVGFRTPEGQPIFTLRRELMSIPASWYLESPDGQRFLDFNGRWSWGKPKFDIQFVNTCGDGKQVTLELRGDWIERDCDICWNGLPVARLRRSLWNGGRMLLGREKYAVQVAQGVDLALIAGLVVGLNASIERKRRH